MGGDRENSVDFVLSLGSHAANSHAAPALTTEGVFGDTLDIAGLGNRKYAGFVGDKVGLREILELFLVDFG